MAKKIVYRKKYITLDGEARRFIEGTFGISSNKCKLFHRSLNVSVDSAQNIGKAHVILHNFVGKRDGFRLEDKFICKGLHKTLFSQKNLVPA